MMFFYSFSAYATVSDWYIENFSNNTSQSCLMNKLKIGMSAELLCRETRVFVAHNLWLSNTKDFNPRTLVLWITESWHYMSGSINSLSQMSMSCGNV